MRGRRSKGIGLELERVGFCGGEGSFLCVGTPLPETKNAPPQLSSFPSERATQARALLQPIRRHPSPLAAGGPHLGGFRVVRPPLRLPVALSLRWGLGSRIGSTSDAWGLRWDLVLHTTLSVLTNTDQSQRLLQQCLVAWPDKGRCCTAALWLLINADPGPGFSDRMVALVDGAECCATSLDIAPSFAIQPALFAGAALEA